MGSVYFYNLENKNQRIIFNEVDSKHEIIVSPFRPEHFGSLIYIFCYYLCNKYNIKLIHLGEANLIPFFSLYSDEAIVYDCSNGIPKDCYQKYHYLVGVEQLQRITTEQIKTDYPKAIFGSRSGVRINSNLNTIFGGTLAKIRQITDLSDEQILKDVSYESIKSFAKKLILNRPVFLNSNSKNILNKLNLKNQKLWFCSHNKPDFKEFENYINRHLKTLVLQQTLWDNKQQIYKTIFEEDCNSFLSTQILASIENDIRFVCSGGATTLFQMIPYIKTIHLTIWDYYALEIDNIKQDFLLGQNVSHKLFHVGGILNNTHPIPFENFQKQIVNLPIPSFSKKLSNYDNNILTYIDEVGRCLIKEKENETNEIIKLL